MNSDLRAAALETNLRIEQKAKIWADLIQAVEKIEANLHQLGIQPPRESRDFSYKNEKATVTIFPFANPPLCARSFFYCRDDSIIKIEQTINTNRIDIYFTGHNYSHGQSFIFFCPDLSNVPDIVRKHSHYNPDAINDVMKLIIKQAGKAGVMLKTDSDEQLTPRPSRDDNTFLLGCVGDFVPTPAF